MDSNQAKLSGRLCFTFAELLGEREILRAYSCGNGRFIPGIPTADQRVCFHLQKEADTLYIQIKDESLLLWLCKITSYCYSLDESVGESHTWIMMEDLLPLYGQLREKFAENKRQGHVFDALELFMRHFLREGSIFAAFGFEHLHEKQILTELHFHDIQSQGRSICEDLDHLDEAIDKLREIDPLCPTNVPVEFSFQCQLQDAIERRDATSVGKLLAANPVFVDAESLWLAIEFYEESVFRLLLKHGLRFAWVDSSEHFYHAANVGQIGAVQLLLSHYGNKTAGLSEKIDMALDGAASGGHLEIVRYLVEDKGANVDGNGDKTPLSHARKHRHKPVIDYLLREGAYSRRNELERLKLLQPWDTLSKSGINYGLPPHLPLYPKLLHDLLRRATQHGDLYCLQGLVELGANLNPKGDCLPCRALIEGHAEVGDWLRRVGAACLQDSWKSPDYLHAIDFQHHESLLPQRTSVASSLSSPAGDDARYCPTVAAILAQERAALERQLFAKVAQSRRKLLDAGARSSATSSLKAFVGQVGTYSSIFKAGTRVIRDITEGYIPSGLFGIVCALQVANAMRSVISDSKIVYSQKDFIKDLPRWASLLNLGDQETLDEIALSLWGTKVPVQERSSDFTCAQTLEFLQRLVNDLVKASRPVNHDFGSSWDSGSYRLSNLRKQHTSVNKGDHPGETRLSLRKWQSSPELDLPESMHIDPPEPPDREKELSTLARITVLMAGAIFGAIILYLCLARWGLSTVHHLALYSAAGQDWDSNQLMAQNCAIISRYIADLVDSGVSMSACDRLPYTPHDATGQSGTFPVDGIQIDGAIKSSCGGDSSVVPSFSSLDAVMDDAPTGSSPSPQSHLETSPAATILPSTTTTANDDSTTAGTLSDGAVPCKFPGCRSVFKLGKAGRRGQNSNRQKHMDTFHSGDPVMYKCGSCGKQGPIKWNMQDHEKRCARKRARRRERGRKAET